MDIRLKWAGCTAGAIAFGLVLGLDAVRAMDPMPFIVPAKPSAPYEPPPTVPGDLHAYPVAVVLTAQRLTRPADTLYPLAETSERHFIDAGVAATEAMADVDIDPLPDSGSSDPLPPQ